MEWELEYQDKLFVINAAIERGLPMPKWGRNEPDIYPGDDFYLSAFWELSTCRNYGWSTGPIPWTAIMEYARFSELDQEVLEMFNLIIRAMDNQYLSWLKRRSDDG